jgi:hypothetical protein
MSKESKTEKPAEKLIEAAVDGGAIVHQTQPPGEVQALEERKKEIAAAFLEGRKASTPAPAKKGASGSAIAIIAVVALFVLLIAAFAIIMWRVSRGEKQLRELVLESIP